jgi:hypothetical protein
MEKIISHLTSAAKDVEVCTIPDIHQTDLVAAMWKIAMIAVSYDHMKGLFLL